MNELNEKEINLFKGGLTSGPVSSEVPNDIIRSYFSLLSGLLFWTVFMIRLHWLLGTPLTPDISSLLLIATVENKKAPFWRLIPIYLGPALSHLTKHQALRSKRGEGS